MTKLMTIFAETVTKKVISSLRRRNGTSFPFGEDKMARHSRLERAEWNVIPVWQGQNGTSFTFGEGGIVFDGS